MRSRLATVLLVASALVLAGCSTTPSDRHPAVQTVVSVLELRRDAVTDAEKYRPYFADPAVADALAASEEATQPPVPAWEEPYVSAESSATAEVVVTWKASKDFPGWPTATVFMLDLVDAGWVITDAADATGDVPVPLENVDQ